jgi:hypothetical protein
MRWHVLTTAAKSTKDRRRFCKEDSFLGLEFLTLLMLVRFVTLSAGVSTWIYEYGSIELEIQRSVACVGIFSSLRFCDG